MLREFSRKLIQEGAKGFSDVDIRSLLNITSISAVERDDSRNYYKCNATLSINYPTDLPNKIATLFSDYELRSKLRDKLEERLGIVNGGGVFAQLNGIIIDGPHGVVPEIPDREELKDYSDTIHKNINSAFSDSLRVTVTYEITDKRDADENQITEFKWYINSRDPLDLNIAILSLHGIF